MRVNIVLPIRYLISAVNLSIMRQRVSEEADHSPLTPGHMAAGGTVITATSKILLIIYVPASTLSYTPVLT